MKILMIGGHRDLIRGLAEHDDLELHGTCSPEYLVQTQNYDPFYKLFPYICGAKLNFRSVSYLRQAIQACQPDIIHAFYGRSLAHTVLATWNMNYAPKIVSFRGITRKESIIADPGNLITYLNRRVGGHACESDAVKQSLIDSGVSADKCATTYQCITPRKMEHTNRENLHLLGIPQDAFVVVTVANIRRVKGTDVLLKAAMQLTDLKELYLLVIGRVVDRRVVRLARDVRIRDRMILTGYRSDAVELMGGADLFVMPSRREGLCTALLEAMSQGVCPIVSDAGGMKEAVRHGVDGLVTPVEDVQALADAIRSLYEQRERISEYSASAKQRIVDFFSPQMVADRTIELYQRVLLS